MKDKIKKKIIEKNSSDIFDEHLSSNDKSKKSGNLRINSVVIQNDYNNNYIIYNELDDDILNNKTMNKIERDLKIIGSYEFVEITDVIERHFILERYFPPYSLIKFSLLNILAITRGTEGQNIKNSDVIKVMCDFCQKTKSLV